jgi:hypothetical protein
MTDLFVLWLPPFAPLDFSLAFCAFPVAFTRPFPIGGTVMHQRIKSPLLNSIYLSEIYQGMP